MCLLGKSSMGRALAAWLMVASAFAAPAATPRDIVESSVTRVVTVLQDAQAGRLSVGRQRTEIKRIAADLFDFEEMARLTLPRDWAVRTPEERAEFVRLLTQLLERTYIRKIESYAGERIVYLGANVDGDYATVRSKVTSSRRHLETPVDYRLSYMTDGHWRVYDVLIDGVSFVSTYRSEFGRVIQRSSYQALVETLSQRVTAAAVNSTRGAPASPHTMP